VKLNDAHGGTRTDASSDYKDDGTNILLDANENAYGPGLALSGEAKPPGANVNGTSDSSYAINVDLLGLNRYPDPYATLYPVLSQRN
jgi:histidinol-phosphate aminotransferase